jgi:hypothetical protein
MELLSGAGVGAGAGAAAGVSAGCICGLGCWDGVCALATLRPDARIATAAAAPMNLLRMTVSIIEFSLPHLAATLHHQGGKNEAPRFLPLFSRNPIL